MSALCKIHLKPVRVHGTVEVRFHRRLAPTIVKLFHSCGNCVENTAVDVRAIGDHRTFDSGDRELDYHRLDAGAHKRKLPDFPSGRSRCR